MDEPINPKAVKHHRDRILNCIPSANTEADWSLETAVGTGVLKTGRIPQNVDLRDEAWWPVGDQGQTGSCVGWAAADSVIRWHMVQAGRLPENQKLSIRQLWMASKETDQFTSPPTTFIEAAGTSLKAALDVARSYGVVTEDILPFGDGHFFLGEQDDFYAMAAQRKILSYYQLRNGLSEWKRWLAQSGPILTRLDCDDAWFDANAANPVLENYVRPSFPGGHAVAIVGYTEDHLIIRNSWGQDHWGDNGYAYASYDYAQDAFTESYGVTV